MVDTTITLITPTRAQGSDGVWRDGAPIEREILARMDSVSRNEFYSGGQSGHRPELRFTVFPAEYRGEKELLWNGVAYAIYRTYQTPGTDDLELYAERNVGVHYGTQNGS